MIHGTPATPTLAVGARESTRDCSATRVGKYDINSLPPSWVATKWWTADRLTTG